MNSKVDIVIPVYNVENYLPKCIESIINQKTEVNFGVILVDDGSTDSSGSLCDSFQAMYPKLIKTIHQQNGGLSAARNTGVANSNAEFITFIDSDDYVSDCYIKDLYSPVENKKADLVINTVTKVKQDTDYKADIEIDSSSLLLDSKQTLEELSYEQLFSNYAVAKLFKRELLLKYKFPENKFYEDSFTIYKIVSESNKIYFSKKSNYFYVQRPGSIQNRAFNKKHLDLVEATTEFREFVNDNFNSHKLIMAAEFRVYKSIYILMIHASKSGYSTFKEVFKYIFGNYNYDYSIIQNDKRARKIDIFMSKVLKTSPFITYCVLRLRNGLNGK